MTTTRAKSQQSGVHYMQEDEGGDRDGAMDSGGYAWEEQYKRSWDVIQEDAHGLLSTGTLRMQELLKRRKYVLKSIPNERMFTNEIQTAHGRTGPARDH